MKLVHFDPETGEVLSAYDTAVIDYPEIPQPHAKVSDADWLRRLNSEGLWAVELPVDGDTAKLVLMSPPAPSLEDAKARALAQMAVWIAELLAPFTDELPQIEVQSWSEKARAAREHIAGKQSPMVEAEAAITGEDPMLLAEAITGAADRYERIIAKVTGLRRSTRMAIEAATDPAELPGILAAAQAQAMALAEAEGIV